MTTPPLVDAEARRRIQDDLDVTLFVEAAAGTGKTTALVTRIVRVLSSGRGALDRVVAVTFTEKAAGEMKLRLRGAIESSRSESSDIAARENLEAALERLELAKIVTIHAFCAELLRERPIEAGVDPLFEVAPDDEKNALLDVAFEDWFQRILSAPGEGVRRVLRRRTGGRYAMSPKQELRSAVGQLVEQRDFPTRWRREAFDRVAAIDAMMTQLETVGKLANESNNSEDWLRKNLEQIAHFVDEVRLIESLPDRSRDHDALEAELRKFFRASKWTWRGNPRAPFGDIPREQVLAQRDQLRDDLEELLRRLDADLAPLLQDELWDVVDAYEEAKHRAGKLDFTDLLLKARDLIRDQATVRDEMQRRFTHYFVDEFQDTDPLQAELLLLLSADDPTVSNSAVAVPVRGKLFLVGDPKQSIYRFRRADIQLYEGIKQRLLAHGADLVHLTTSFRGVPSLQRTVNEAFRPLMSDAESGQAEYVALQPHRAEPSDQPTVIALPTPNIYSEYGRVAKWIIDESAPVGIAAFIDWLIHESGWRVTDRERPHERVPVEPRHVCILFRRMVRYRDDVTRPYVRALEARRIPHVLVGGRSFHERDEVLMIRNSLAAIEWPDDELRVYAALRGPLFALTDDALLSYRNRPRDFGPEQGTREIGKLHPLVEVDRAILDDAEREVADALAILRRLHYSRNRRSIARTIGRLLKEVRAHAGVAIWPTGEQALANVTRILELAHRFERRGAPSFRAFVEQLEEAAERGDTPDAPAVEEGTDGIRIMTVHRAKGLEFPVVILADPTCTAFRADPSRHVDTERQLFAQPLCGCAPVELTEQREIERQREKEEAIRLTYVAATRARDLLVVPVVGDLEPSQEGSDEVVDWLDPLNAAIYPDPAQKRDGTAVAGLPRFGDDSVLDRPASARRGPNGSIRPGLHTSRAGTDVVWWDPAALDLGRDDQTKGLRQDRILQADAGGADERSVIEHARWQETRTRSIDAGATKSLDVRTVTAIAHDEESTAPKEFPIETTDVDRSKRPRGKRFGTLVHATLAVVALDADVDAIVAVVRHQARILGADEAEILAAVEATAAALKHPILQRALRSAKRGELRREAPILLKREDGSIAEGTLDLAFREGEGDDAEWIVVDFKTDRELSEQRDAYGRQLDLYAEAITTATGVPARGLLLRV